MRKIFVPLLIAAVLVGALSAAVDAQTTWQRMENVWVKAFRTTNNADVGGALSVTGITSLSGALSGTSANFTSGISTNNSVVAYGATSVGTFLSLQPGAVRVVTNGGTITPLASYQPISSTTAVGTSDIAAAGAGTVLRLINVGTQTITLTDTGTLYLSGNIALGANDSLLLMSKGTGEGWVQIGTSDN